jgi:hypothetical protein
LRRRGTGGAGSVACDQGDVAMKKRMVLLKLAAVASSLLLVAGLVSYRAGAFNWLLESRTPAADLATDDAILDPATWETLKKNIEKTDPTFMYSSKSIAPLIVRPKKSSKAPGD